MSNNNIILISLTKSELQDLVSTAVKQELERTLCNSSKSVQTELITKKEAAKLLRISLPTLSERIKTGFVPAYRIGCRVLLEKTEVLKSLNKIKTI